MAGILDSLFGDLQGTSAGGLLGLLGGGGGIGTATRRLRTPEEEQQAAALYGGNLNLPSQIPTGFPAGTLQAPPQDYVGTPGALDPKWQALLAGNTDPYQPNAQLPPTATPTAGAQNGPGVTLPQLGDSGFGRDTGPQNPLMGLLGGIGNLFSGSAAQAAPAPGTAQQPGIPAPAAAGPGLFGRLQAGATNLSSGGNPLAGIINAVGGLATGERTDRQGIALKNQAATAQAYYQALRAQGVSDQQAMALAQAASTNSEVAKTIAPQLYRTPTIEKLKDATGAENAYLIDPVKGTRTELKDTGGGTVGGTGGPQMLAAGVKQYNPGLTGNDYMGQFGPEIQSIAKMYLNGDEMPTGNPRTQGIIPFSKIVAAKYAQDMGIPFSDSLYAAKRDMKVKLAESSNSSTGGILANGDSSLAHLADAAKDAAKLKNVDVNYPGGGYLAHGINRLQNQGGGSDRFEQVGKVRQNLGRYGQESTKFYAASGGGEGERMAALKDHDPNAESSAEMAGFYEKEKSLLLDRLNGQLDHIRQVLGPEEGDREIAKRMPRINASLAKLDANIAKLRGEPAPQQGAEGQQKGAPSQLRPIDKAAIDWANANPKDPRAAAIKQRLGVQ